MTITAYVVPSTINVRAEELLIGLNPTYLSEENGDKRNLTRIERTLLLSLISICHVIILSFMTTSFISARLLVQKFPITQTQASDCKSCLDNFIMFKDDILRFLK